VAKKTLSKFLKELPGFGDDITNAMISDWNRETYFALSDAQSMAPVAGGFLFRSGTVTKEAKFSKNRGITSSFSFQVPYAEKLDDKDGDFNLVPAGETSYYVNGIGRGITCNG
jgi:hypothetical protein